MRDAGGVLGTIPLRVRDGALGGGRGPYAVHLALREPLARRFAARGAGVPARPHRPQLQPLPGPRRGLPAQAHAPRRHERGTITPIC